MAGGGSSTQITFHGNGFLKLHRGIYKPKYSIRLFTVLSDSEMTVDLPCRTMGTGVHRLTFTMQGSSAEYTQSGQIAVASEQPGLRFVCSPEPRFTALRPVVGPSWQGSAVTLTTTLVNCLQPNDQLFRCNPPPLDIFDRVDPLATSGFRNYPKTSQFGRCRWICSQVLGCYDSDPITYRPLRW